MFKDWTEGLCLPPDLSRQGPRTLIKRAQTLCTIEIQTFRSMSGGLDGEGRVRLQRGAAGPLREVTYMQTAPSRGWLSLGPGITFWLLAIEHARGPLRPRFLFWLYLAVQEITPNLSSIKRHCLLFPQRSGIPTGHLSLFHSVWSFIWKTQSWGDSKGDEQDHQKAFSLMGLAADASCQLAPLCYKCIWALRIAWASSQGSKVRCLRERAFKSQQVSLQLQFLHQGSHKDQESSRREEINSLIGRVAWLWKHIYFFIHFWRVSLCHCSIIAVPFRSPSVISLTSFLCPALPYKALARYYLTWASAGLQIPWDFHVR